MTVCDSVQNCKTVYAIIGQCNHHMGISEPLKRWDGAEGGSNVKIVIYLHYIYLTEILGCAILPYLYLCLTFVRWHICVIYGIFGIFDINDAFGIQHLKSLLTSIWVSKYVSEPVKDET